MRLLVLLLLVLMGLTSVLLLPFFVIAPTIFNVAWQPPNDWSIQFGETPKFGNGVTSVLAASDSLYSSGYIGYPLQNKNASTSGLFISRYDSDGRQAWNRSFAPYTITFTNAEGPIVSGPPPQTTVTLGVGGVIVAGSLGKIGFMRDFDTNGNQLWDVQFYGCQFESGISDVSESPSAVYAVETCRMANQTIDELQVYSVDGKRIWNSTIGLDPQGVRSVTVYSFSDGAIVSSSEDLQGNGFLQRYDPNGSLLWTKQLDCTRCAITAVSVNGAAIYVAGNVQPARVGYSSYSNLFFLDKYDLAGNQFWSHQFSPTVDSYHIRMSVDSSGIYLALAEVPDYNFGSISRYDNNGNRVWSLETNFTPCAISAANDHIYVGGGGGCFGPLSRSGTAFVASFRQTSSLIFLGLNPPFSFVLATAIPIVIAVAFLVLRKYCESRDIPRNPYRPVEGVPRD